MAVLALLPSAGLPAVAQAKCGAPFEFATPGTLDVVSPVLAISGSGAAAAAFGIQDVDTPGVSQGYVTLRPAHSAPGKPIVIPGAQQILAATYDGRSLELLTGAGPSRQTCCSSAQAVRVGAGGRPERARTLVGGLAGATQGRLLTLRNGAMLAAVATERGVWVIQSAKANRFGGQHLLTHGGQMPESLDAAWLGGQSTIVAWTAARGVAGQAAPRSISYALGTKARPPHRVKTAVTVRAGHRIEELGVAARNGGATAAWVESWFDKGNTYHSIVRAMDIAPHATVRNLSAANRLASGLSFGGDLAGDQAVAWASCTFQASCQTQVSGRGAHGSFGPVRTVGAVDASQQPSLAVGAHGQVLVGWVRGGRPVAATAASAGRRFGRPVTLSSTTFALDLTVGFGSGGAGMAAWTQGTLNPSVVGAAYSG
ncbi:MAG: hypothetical protein ACRDPM_10360 [Solirubrobacteraceae bacterium]